MEAGGRATPHEPKCLQKIYRRSDSKSSTSVIAKNPLHASRVRPVHASYGLAGAGVVFIIGLGERLRTTLPTGPPTTLTAKTATKTLRNYPVAYPTHWDHFPRCTGSSQTDADTTRKAILCARTQRRHTDRTRHGTD